MMKMMMLLSDCFIFDDFDDFGVAEQPQWIILCQPSISPPSGVSIALIECLLDVVDVLDVEQIRIQIRFECQH